MHNVNTTSIAQACNVTERTAWIIVQNLNHNFFEAKFENGAAMWDQYRAEGLPFIVRHFQTLGAFSFWVGGGWEGTKWVVRSGYQVRTVEMAEAPEPEVEPNPAPEGVAELILTPAEVAVILNLGTWGVVGERTGPAWAPLTDAGAATLAALTARGLVVEFRRVPLALPAVYKNARALYNSVQTLTLTAIAPAGPYVHPSGISGTVYLHQGQYYHLTPERGWLRYWDMLGDWRPCPSVPTEVFVLSGEVIYRPTAYALPENQPAAQ